MKKCLLRSFAVLVLTLGSSALTWAENVVYGLIPSYTFGAKTTSLDLESVNTTTATSLTPGFNYTNVKDVKCGVTVGDKYYAFVNYEDPTSYDEVAALATFNFTSGNMVVVNDFSYNYGKPGYNASAMTYDEENDVVYVTEIGFNSNDEYVTKLYSMNPTDGSLTSVTSWLGQYQAIASDHNGGFYLLQNTNADSKIYANLFKASPTSDPVQVVTNNSLSTGWSSYNSMVASNDGKTVYLVENSSVFAFDLDKKAVSLKGKLSDNVCGISYGKSTADGTAATKPGKPTKKARFLIKTLNYGNSMGDIPETVDAKREYFYYNTDGKLVGSAETGRGYGDSGYSDVFKPTNITKYTFDDNGNITKKDVYQWGVYDFDDFAWKKTKNYETYVYNDNNQLTSDSTSYDFNVYTYNPDGTLAKKENWTRYNKKNAMQTLTYSNYDENGNALHISSTGAYDSYNYEAELMYDEDGNKVEEYTYTVVEDPNMAGETINKPKSLEQWTYKDGILSLDEKFSFDDNGEQVPTGKTVYTPVDGNINDIAVADSTYSNGTWYRGNFPKRCIYGDFTDMAEMTKMEAMAEPDPDVPNTVDIEFSVPELAISQTCSVIIYRDCLPIDTVSLLDAFNDDTQTCIYKDKNVKNGTYTYFLQPIFTANSEFEPFDESGIEGPSETQWTGYYSTNPMVVNVYTELPKATDLTLVGGRAETTGSLISKRTTYYADLSWKNPEDMDKYGFIKNSIYFTGAGVAELDTTNVDAHNAEVMLYDEDASAYIVTSYKLGKAISDTIDIKFNDVKNLATGVEAVTVNGVVGATFSNNVLTLSEPANVSVFAANGQKVYAKDNTDNVALGNLPAATYIICVEKNGKVSGYKYRVE